jgi:hypothetical protein
MLLAAFALCTQPAHSVGILRCVIITHAMTHMCEQLGQCTRLWQWPLLTCTFTLKLFAHLATLQQACARLVRAAAADSTAITTTTGESQSPTDIPFPSCADSSSVATGSDSSTTAGATAAS